MSKPKICKWDIEYSSVITAHIPQGDGTFKTYDFRMIPDGGSCDYVEEQLGDKYEITE
jgi:hypothetical protein